MKKNNIIKKNEDYSRMIHSIKPHRYKDYVIYLEWTKEETYHFGFSISKKICNAVNRNRIKRQLKSIIDQKDYQNGFNCIIMVRRGILEKPYSKMEEELYQCFQTLGILKGEKK